MKMKFVGICVLLAAAFLTAAAADTAELARQVRAAAFLTAAAADTAELARQVRAAETAFAKTRADRDWDAFTACVSGEAVFFGRQAVLRGRDAVADGWKPYFQGAKAPFSWQPEQVEALASGRLALSSLDPEGKRIGTFQSIWRLEADGRWRIVFDKGCPACEQADKPQG
jgi:ketosteroid isomerase-like protein